MIYFKKIRADAILPSRGSAEAAGLDLSAVDGMLLRAGTRALFNTGLAVELPWGAVGYIRPRSKLALKYGIDVLAGVVDSDYRGEIKVLLINTGDEDVYFGRGDRVAQFVVQPVDMSAVQEVSDVDSSARGSSGITDSDMRM